MSLISLVGVPSPRFYATLNIIRALTQLTLGEHIFIACNSFSALQSAFPSPQEREGRAVILASDYPNLEMLDTFARVNAPLAICVEDFRAIAHFSVVSRDFDGVSAARFASMALVNIEPLLISPPRLSLIVDSSDINLAGFIQNLAALYRLPTNADTLEQVFAYIGMEGVGDYRLRDYLIKAITFPSHARETLDRRNPLDNELIDFLAPQYDNLIGRHRLRQLEWPAFALTRPETPDHLVGGPTDLTGPARFLCYGPYFALPSGDWKVEVEFEVADCLSENVIGIDIFAGRIIAAVKAKLPAYGAFACDLWFTIDDPSRAVEVRMQLMTGAIEGEIAIRRLLFTRRTPDFGEANS